MEIYKASYFTLVSLSSSPLEQFHHHRVILLYQLLLAPQPNYLLLGVPQIPHMAPSKHTVCSVTPQPISQIQSK